jgi:hypothetical protein
MTGSTQNELVGKIARDVVAQIAPQELPIFPAISQAYFANPADVLKNVKSEDRALGFGLDPTLLLTPIVLTVLSDIFVFLVEIAKKALEDGLGNETSEIIKRMFSRSDSSKAPVLTKQQITLIHGKVLTAAKKLRLSDDKAASLADAVAVQFFAGNQ